MERKYFAHKTAEIDEDVSIGDGTKVWHLTHILRGTAIGKDCVIGQGCSIGPEVSIGDGCKIQNGVSVFKGVTLEDHVFCGPHMIFTNVNNPRAFIKRSEKFEKTLVQRGASIGAGAIIVCGNTIGRYAFIGAGSLITKDVPNYALFFGVPAIHQGYVCECGEVITRETKVESRREYECGGCHAKYEHIREKFNILKTGDHTIENEN